MASIPRRRRHNKHNESYIQGIKKTGEIENIPCSRKAFKASMKRDEVSISQDRALILNALYGINIGDVVFITTKGLNNPKLSGYYSRNSKGPVKMSDEMVEMFKEGREKIKELRSRSFDLGDD